MQPSNVNLNVLNACAVALLDGPKKGLGPVDGRKTEGVVYNQRATVGFVVDTAACLQDADTRLGDDVTLGRDAADYGIHERAISYEAVAEYDVFNFGR